MREHISLVALINVDGLILLERRKNGVWALLGGHTELFDESRIEAAFRELFEESLSVNIVHKRHLLIHDDERHFVDVFTGDYRGAKMPTPLVGDEATVKRWFNLEKAKRLPLTTPAKMAIEALQEESRRLVPEYVDYSQMILNEATINGCDDEEMAKLKQKLKEAGESISGTKRPKDAEHKGDILLVENDQGVLKTFKDALEYSHFRVHPFSDPRDALDWLCGSEIEIDALITDFWMPHMNGHELIQEMRLCMNPCTKILLLSAREVPDEAKKGVMFFEKPVLLSELIRAIT